MTVARYIHQNPVKAGLTERIGQYPWSSYRRYCGEQGEGIADCQLLLGILGGSELFRR